MAKYVNFNGSGMKLPTGSEETGGFLSKIKSAGSSISTSNIIIMLVVVLFIGIAIYYYYNHVSSSMKPEYNPNHEHLPSSSSSKSAELLLFYVDWCPHCKTAKPVWEEVKAEYQNKTVNGYQVMCTEINCTNETPDVEQMMNKYSIEGFPTIKLLKDGQVIEYDAKPTKATLEQFLNTVL